MHRHAIPTMPPTVDCSVVAATGARGVAQIAARACVLRRMALAGVVVLALAACGEIGPAQAADPGDMSAGQCVAEDSAAEGSAAGTVADSHGRIAHFSAATPGTPAAEGTGTEPNALAAGSSLNMLWVGNSLTDTAPELGNYELGPLPARIAPMLAEFGITLLFDHAIQGGAEFNDHRNNADTMARLARGGYDVVNLQGYYEGFASADDYIDAVRPLYEVAHAAGASVLFEAVWSFQGDPGSPQYPASVRATEGAAQALPASQSVPVARVWAAVEDADPALHARLYGDATHQSALGEYLNALIYTRFLSGRSVVPVQSMLPRIAEQTNAAERGTLKALVDREITEFHVADLAPRVTMTVTRPQVSEVFEQGVPVPFRAQALDNGNDVSARIQWQDAGGTVLFDGPAFERVFEPGRQRVIATVAGERQPGVSTRRDFIVRGGSNLPPLARGQTLRVQQGETFRQVSLTGSVRDEDGSIDWSSIEIDTRGFSGRSLIVDARSEASLNLDYGNAFSGCDRVRWRVRDDGAAWSNWAELAIDVMTAPPR